MEEPGQRGTFFKPGILRMTIFLPDSFWLTVRVGSDTISRAVATLERSGIGQPAIIGILVIILMGIVYAKVAMIPATPSYGGW